ncbi:Endoribonuclease L-PSP/chorismate mutase-like protein [Entophlyctis helioformis]|nr:Endoribonuclease L-PSP/chorismate mutase-like protein [Entophlyctis helioformis]KAI8927611.1 Endoribonuclease L-PSP/chorismate mutase-like protein [Entophlyctis helioformis]
MSEAVTAKSTVGPNGESFVLTNKAQSLANYPHARRVGGFIFVSGISSRRFDNTWEGVEELADGTFRLDIKAQTRAVLNNIKAILSAAGAGMEHLVDLTVFLVDMANYAEFNTVYNEFLDNAETGPTRTTVAVKQLPNPRLLIEIKATAVDPSARSA